jgi:hypothetical protein
MKTKLAVDVHRGAPLGHPSVADAVDDENRSAKL